MPQQLRTDPAQLRQKAGHLDGVNEAATEQLSQNASALSSAQTAWAGTTFHAYEQLRDTWEQADTARAKHLDDIATSLSRSAALYQFADESSAEAVDRTL